MPLPECSRLPDSPELVDAPTYARMYNDAEISAGRAAKYTVADIEKYRTGTDPAYPNTNWYKETFRASAPISQYNLNTSGGSEQMSYFVSLGYLSQNGLLRSGDTKYKRYNIRSNIDAKITKSFFCIARFKWPYRTARFPRSEYSF
ncbi:MAG: hypothetical protein HC830_04345, partial [Bacteroidetes bacterium]|nr:hypothetical protein [Bacteroidota bacterium]